MCRVIVDTGFGRLAIGVLMCRDIVDGHDDGLCLLWIRIVSFFLLLFRWVCRLRRRRVVSKVSRQWVHVLLARYAQGGEAGLEPRSRRPATNPAATTEAVRARIRE